MDGNAVDVSVVERRWAAVDRVVGISFLVAAGVCFAVALLGFASQLAGNVVHPDAVLIPLVASVVPAGAGALFLLAASAMRRRSAGRWTAQWGALLAPAILAVFVCFSLL